MGEPRWLPLESNPDVMNKYVENLGVPASWQFTDVYGFEPDLLAIVPKPVVAVMLLYPISDKSEATAIGTEDEKAVDTMYFMKQTVGNACGTVALIHAILNNTNSIMLEEGKHLKTFLEVTKEMTPAERGKYLENDTKFGEAHDESAQEGQTQAPSRDENVKCHFVAFVHHSGGLYELDGRKDAPLHHGPTTAETLLQDATQVVKKFMARDPDELNFTVVSLSKV